MLLERDFIHRKCFNDFDILKCSPYDENDARGRLT